MCFFYVEVKSLAVQKYILTRNRRITQPEQALHQPLHQQLNQLASNQLIVKSILLFHHVHYCARLHLKQVFAKPPVNVLANTITVIVSSCRHNNDSDITSPGETFVFLYFIAVNDVLFP